MAAGGLQCPFADSDYDKILLLERSSSAQEGWRQARSSDGCVVWQKKVPDQNIHLVKVRSFVAVYHFSMLCFASHELLTTSNDYYVFVPAVTVCFVAADLGLCLLLVLITPY